MKIATRDSLQSIQSVLDRFTENMGYYICNNSLLIYQGQMPVTEYFILKVFPGYSLYRTEKRKNGK